MTYHTIRAYGPATRFNDAVDAYHSDLDSYPSWTRRIDGFGDEVEGEDHQTSNNPHDIPTYAQVPSVSIVVNYNQEAASDAGLLDRKFGFAFPRNVAKTVAQRPTLEDSICFSGSDSGWSLDMSAGISSGEQSTPRLLTPISTSSQRGFVLPFTRCSPFLDHSPTSPTVQCLALRDLERSPDAEPWQDHMAQTLPVYGSAGQYYAGQTDPFDGLSIPIIEDQPLVGASMNLTPPRHFAKHEDAASECAHLTIATPTPSLLHPSPTATPARRRKSRNNSVAQSTTCPYPMKRPRVERLLHSTNPATIRPFPCPFAQYGCPTTLSSKNEWKRHTTSQHLCLGFYRCDMCAASGRRSPNDFNRKDLFTQHLRRIHGPGSATGFTTVLTCDGASSASPYGTPGSAALEDADETFEACLKDIRDRCWITVRAPPPASACLFCPQLFVGEGSWDARMEHLGRHLEEAVARAGLAPRRRKVRRSSSGSAGKPTAGGASGLGPASAAGLGLPSPSAWNVDVSLQAWMLGEGLLYPSGQGGYALVPHGRFRAVQDVGSAPSAFVGRYDDEDAYGEDE